MKWVRRGLWIAAWGVWLWLGVGLYRELPRELGPVVCKLPLGRDFYTLGFMGETNHFAVVSGLGTDQSRVGVFDAIDGSLVRETRWHASTSLAGFPSNTDKPMLVFAEEAPTDDGQSTLPVLSVFDLNAFKWQRLSSSFRLTLMAFDPVRKICVCIHGSGRRAVFIDLANGRELTVREIPNGWSFNGASLVDPTHGFVTLSWINLNASIVSDLEQANAHVLEVWKLDRPPTMAWTVPYAVRQVPISASQNGRIAFTEWGTRASFQVYDLAERKWIYESPEIAEPLYDPKKPGVANNPLISPNGRTVLDGRWSSLWDIDSKRLLWSKKDHEVVIAGRGDSTFLVREEWSKILPTWFPSLRFETWAMRDLETGDMVFRTSAKDSASSFKLNSARSLVVSNDGTVCRLPLIVNWPLLALCQTILALPLILLLALLRWHRKRRLRLESVTP